MLFDAANFNTTETMVSCEIFMRLRVSELKYIIFMQLLFYKMFVICLNVTCLLFFIMFHRYDACFTDMTLVSKN